VIAEFQHHLSEITLVPSTGGVFEVTLDDDLIYSKKATGEHADPEVVLKDLRRRLGH
jgi:selenoprotein W-related protein